jgi:aryl-alcohol dehydrogenase-like predicted oxidoreductase
MELRVLGDTGVKVSSLCLGAMAFGSLGNRDQDDCIRIIHAALDGGINAIDTADVYSRGESEQIVGRALRGRRDSVVLGTKCFWPMGPDPNQRGLSRRWIVLAVEASLRRLGTDRIDILYLHKPDPDTAIGESLSAASDLVHQGKVRLIGTSSVPAEQVVGAEWAAAGPGLERPRVEQPAYSIFARAIETDVLPACLAAGIGVMVFSPLNGGWLTGKYHRDRPPNPESRSARWPNDHSMRLELPTARRKFDLIEDLSALARESALTVTQLAMAFAVEHPAVTSAIIGPRTMSQLDELLGSADVRLDTNTLDRIDHIVRPGVDVDPADRWYRPTGLEPAARRRGRAIGGQEAQRS